tara:strand:- start:1203 stop:1427 length:225 start_codon:yes stop_codon:yes gene_type:complete
VKRVDFRPRLERLRVLSFTPRTGAALSAVLEKIIDEHLKLGPAQGWIDKLDARDQPTADPIPANVIYHLVTHWL